MSKRNQYKLGEPLGDSLTQVTYGKHRIYGGGGGGKSTTTQNIPTELKPLANEYTSQAIGLSKTPYSPYTGDRFADLNQTQQSGLNLATNRALGGSDVMNAGQQNVMDTLSGKFMNANPYMDAMFKNAASGITDAYRTGTAAQTDASAARSRNIGGSAYEQMVVQNERNLANSLSDAAANIYGQNYNNERANQLQAWNAAQSYGQAPYQDASQLMNAGQVLQDQAQQGKDFNYQQFMEQQNLPYKNLAAMSGVFNSNLGGSSTTSGGGK